MQCVRDYWIKYSEQLPPLRERYMDEVKALETTLSTEFPPERYINLMVLLRMFGNPDSTSEEIEKTMVNYKLNFYFLNECI